MQTQMIAERERRGQFIAAEGQKTALRIRSEGTKVMKQNDGLAEQESTRKISEGTAQSRIELARAESQSLEMIRTVIQTNSNSQTQYMLAMRYLELLNMISHQNSNKTIYLPYEIDNLSGSIRNLNSIYGKKKNSANNKEYLIPQVTSDFDDLN